MGGAPFGDNCVKLRASSAAALYVFVAAASRAAPFFLLPIYSYVLTPAEIAAYGIAAGLAQLLSILSDGGLGTGIMRTFYDLHPDEDKAAYFLALAMISRALALVVLVISVLPVWLIWGLLFDPSIPIWSTLPLILGASFLRRSNNLMGTFYRLQENHLGYTINQLLPPLLQIVIGLSLVLVFHQGFLGAMATLPAGFGIAAIVNLIRVRRARATRRKVSLAELKEVFALGSATLPDELAIWGQQLAVRLALALFSTTLQAAIFVFANAPAQLFGPVIDGVQMFVTPVYFRAMKTNEARYLRQLRSALAVYLGTGAIASLGAIGLFDPLLHAFAPIPYRNSGNVAALMVAGMMLRGQAMMITNQLRYAKRNLAGSTNSIIALVVGYGVFAILVPSTGAAGAAVSVCVFSGASLALNFRTARELEGHLLTPRQTLFPNCAVLIALIVQNATRLGDMAEMTRYLVTAGACLILGCAVIVRLIIPNREIILDAVIGRFRKAAGAG